MKRRTSSQNSGVGGGPSDCDIMASGSPDATCASEACEAAEECSGKKKSKFQTFKNFFVKKKRKESPPPLGDNVLKASQSSDDVTSGPPIVQTIIHDELGSKINMGNKAMSHDSVFVSDSLSPEALGASQDSIQGKVKSLQLQLKQAIRLGSPPAFIFGKKAEDTGAFSDDDGLPCSPPEYSSLHTVLATPPHTMGDMNQRGSCLSMEASDSDDDQMSYESSSRPGTPQGPVPTDFSVPASSVCCLDSTAARHRIAVKAKACARRKPVSREMLQNKRRDLREKLLLKETDDKLRMVTSIVEEEGEYSPMIDDSDHETQQSKTANTASEEVSDSTQSRKASPKSSISTGDSSEEEERVSDQDHVHKSEIHESPWESPVTLQLQADDFLLDTGCEVIPEGQGSLLEEVLSSLKSPLVSGLAVEHENVVQSEVEDVNTQSIEARLEEKANKDLLGPSEPTVTTKEQVPLPDSLSDSTVDSEEITEETLEKEEPLQVPKFANVAKANVEKKLDKTVNAKEEVGKKEFGEKLLEKTETTAAFAMKEKNEDRRQVSNKVELEKETKIEKISDLMVVKLEKREDATNAEQPPNVKDETPADKRESKVTDAENVSASDQTVKADALNSVGISDQTKASGLPLVEVISSTVSHQLESPIPHSTFSNTSACPLGKEKDPELSDPHGSNRPQDVSSEKLEVVSEQKEVVGSPVGQQTSSTEVRPRFTIAPAWQRSLASGVAKDQLQITSPVVPETELTKTSNESLQTTELLTPAKEERPSKPTRTQSSPARIQSSPARIQSSPAQIQSSPAQIQSSPARIQSSPARIQSSPARIQSSPAQIQSSPAQIQSSPAQIQSSPARIQSSPARIQSSSAQIQISPARIQSSPARIQSSAAQIQSSAAQIQSSAAQIQSSAAQIQSSPARIQSSPAQIQSSPAQIQSSPAQIQSSPAQIQSSSALPVQKEMPLAQEESAPDNPFGVRLRRTAVLRRYGLDGESSWNPTQTSQAESECLETPNIDHHESKTVVPKKPDLLDTVMSVRKVSDSAGRISAGDTESPSWISVARQKQKNFIENSTEENHPSQEDFKMSGSLPSYSNSITQEQLVQPCSTIKVFCSLEISNTSVVEKESKRTAIPSTAPLAQDEPPWMALAKKKAKAWSEMPQIVQ